MDHCFFFFWSEPVKMIKFLFLASLTKTKKKKSCFSTREVLFCVSNASLLTKSLRKTTWGEEFLWLIISVCGHLTLLLLDPCEAQHHGGEDVGRKSDSLSTWWAGGGDSGQGMSFKGVSKATCFHVANSPFSSELTNELAQGWCQQPDGQSTTSQDLPFSLWASGPILHLSQTSIKKFYILIYFT